jgi:Sec-independent protein translocase protein TatA
MSEKRVLRKLNKLASRIYSKIESVRDEMDDLEIEFELLQQQIKKLQAKAGNKATASDEVEVILEVDEDNDDEEIDLENTSAVNLTKKF